MNNSKSIKGCAMETLLPLEKELSLMSKILPSFAFNGKEDFALWQKRAKDKLKELLGMDKFVSQKPEISIEYDRETDEFRDIRFYFLSEEGYFVPCHLCIPLNAKERLPLMICLQGHSTGMHISLGRARNSDEKLEMFKEDGDFAVRAVKEGFAALAVEQRHFGECGSDNGNPNCYKGAMSALLIGRTTIGERVWDIISSIDAITEFFSDIIDINRIGCLGNSGGGTATFYASIIDERVKLSVPSCCVCTYDSSIAPIRHCACNFVPHIREYFNMGDLGGLIAPRKLVVVAGEKDTIFPIDGAKESFWQIKYLYEKAGAPENAVMVIGKEGHRFYKK